eukprot:scaffold59617_cov79-Phaeocystis_antarctica.AAC.8
MSSARSRCSSPPAGGWMPSRKAASSISGKPEPALTPHCSLDTPATRCVVSPTRTSSNSKYLLANCGTDATSASGSYMLNATMRSQMGLLPSRSLPSPPQKVSQNQVRSQRGGSPVRAAPSAFARFQSCSMDDA